MSTITVAEIIDKYEIPQELHAAIWQAFEDGTEYGFWKAVNSVAIPAVNDAMREEL